MVLTANLHTAEGRVRGRLVALGEGGGSRSSAHPEAVSTASASTSASTPTPRIRKGSLPTASRSPAAPAASTRLGWPVIPATLLLLLRHRLKLTPVVVVDVSFSSSSTPLRTSMTVAHAIITSHGSARSRAHFLFLSLSFSSYLLRHVFTPFHTFFLLHVALPMFDCYRLEGG